MTVQELIDQLRQLPPDHIVLVEGYENGWDTLVSIEPSHAAWQTPCAEWDGEFERTAVSDSDAANSVLLIGRRGHRRAPM
jgi:hypothetical protein